MSPRPVVALVATPKFKIEHKRDLQQFVCEHLYTLTYHFDVISTGKTYAEISSFIRDDAELLKQEHQDLIEKDLGHELTEAALRGWRESIQTSFKEKKIGIAGMIEIAHELVTGKLEAIIQLSVEDDTTVRAGSAVLRREANVHNVPIASDVATARVFIDYWKNKLKSNGNDASSLFRPRKEVESPCEALLPNGGDHVLALIAHDGQKHEMSQFVVKYKEKLLHFPHILATRESGELAKQHLRVAGWGEADVKRIMLCNRGRMGGDVEIAYAVIQGRCKNVVFFQDPATSHPHEADIRLFEQAVLKGTDVRLASNAESARILLEAIEARPAENVVPLNSEIKPRFDKPNIPAKEDHCFYLCPFKEPFDSIYRDHASKALAEEGFSIQRADEIFGTRAIIDDIWEGINSSSIIVADVTERNPNVMYEIGMAHTVGKQVVIIAQDMDDVPIDLRGMRCITYEYTPDGCQALEHRLKSTVRLLKSKSKPPTDYADGR